mgnify:CR=1 FL=1
MEQGAPPPKINVISKTSEQVTTQLVATDKSTEHMTQKELLEYYSSRAKLPTKDEIISNLGPEHSKIL